MGSELVLRKFEARPGRFTIIHESLEQVSFRGFVIHDSNLNEAFVKQPTAAQTTFRARSILNLCRAF